MEDEDGAFNPEPEGPDIARELRVDHPGRWPHFWYDIHRVEASVRPRSMLSGGYDRRPPGLIERILECDHAFGPQRIIHLGLVDRESLWAPVMLWARIEGVQNIIADAKALGKNPKAAEANAKAVIAEVERLASLTADHGFPHPESVLKSEV